MEQITLQTQAKDNHGRSYPVILKRNAKYGQGKLSVYFDGAPSGWYLKTLLRECKGDILAIDFGQGWNCINIQDILSEIKGMVGI